MFPTFVVMDLGSNSFHLCIATTNTEGDIVEQHKYSEKVQLAAGLDIHNRLSSTAIDLGLECLRHFNQKIDRSCLSAARFVATHTLRQAHNRHDFLHAAAQFLPTPIEVISGQEEAELIYWGSLSALPDTEINPSTRFVFDIGGGSTEFIIGQGEHIVCSHSVPIGSVGLSMQSTRLNPAHDFQSIFAYAYEQAYNVLAPVLGRFPKQAQHIIGCSGTLKIVCHLLHAEGLTLSPNYLTRDALYAYIQYLSHVKDIQQVNFHGIHEKRKSVLPAGLAIIAAIMDTYPATYIEYSTGALREGLLNQLIQHYYAVR